MKYVSWLIISMDKEFSFAEYYLTKQGWNTSARKDLLRFSSLKEARLFYSSYPRGPHPRVVIWASGSRAKQTMFHPFIGHKYNEKD